MTDEHTPASEPPPPFSLHPECPDVARLGPDRVEGELRARAARVQLEREERADVWRKGFTRRRFLAGAGAAGVATAAHQLVTTRASFGATNGTGTLVVIFLRGGVDGLAAVVPGDDPHLLQARPDIAIPASTLLPLDRGFGLHPQLRPLHELWNRGQFTAVPATSTPDLSRSHFQAMDCLERGGSAAAGPEGWLDRVLTKLGPGTTFRAVSQGTTMSRALAGSQPTLTLNRIESFKLSAWEGVHDKTLEALRALYTGLDHPMAAVADTTFRSLDTSRMINAVPYEPASPYPDEGAFPEGMAELARLIKADVGLRVACIDFGGWDQHIHQGGLDDGEMARLLRTFGWTLGAFASDLGDRFNDVTVVAMTEFGRRVEQNASHGTDHGHGSVVFLAGGGLAGGTIHGNWQGLAPEVRDQGDVPGLNDFRNVLGEVVNARLGVSVADLADVFPGHQVQPIGVMRH